MADNHNYGKKGGCVGKGSSLFSTVHNHVDLDLLQKPKWCSRIESCELRENKYKYTKL